MAATTSAVPVPQPSRRLQRGARYQAYNGPSSSTPLSLSTLDSAFQLQEYIAQLIKHDPHDVDTIVMLPDSSNPSPFRDGGDGQLKEKEFEVDQNCWLYEQLRRLAQDLTYPLITLLQQECTRSSCPEMKAGEWLYLCVAHGNGGAMEQCCAIDYVLHTLDSATALLNSARNFPSRIAIPATSTRHFSSLARRLSRIFAHAYFHHRELFEQAESENSLYERFLGLVREFHLVPAEFLVIPWEGRPNKPPKIDVTDAHSTSSNYEGSFETQTESRDYPLERSKTILQRSYQPNLDERPSEDITGSPSGGTAFGRKRTDTMYFSGDLATLDPILGAGLRHDSPVEHPEHSTHVQVSPTHVDDMHAHSADTDMVDVSLDDREPNEPEPEDEDMSSGPDPSIAVGITANSEFFDDADGEERVEKEDYVVPGPEEAEPSEGEDSAVVGGVVAYADETAPSPAPEEDNAAATEEDVEVGEEAAPEAAIEEDTGAPAGVALTTPEADVEEEAPVPAQAASPIPHAGDVTLPEDLKAVEELLLDQDDEKEKGAENTSSSI